jgi:hypothetical protein
VSTRWGPSEATHHQVDDDDADDDLTSLRLQLVIFAQTPVALEPPPRPLHDPPFRTYFKAPGALGPLDDVQTYGPMPPQRPNPGDQWAGRGLIGPDEPQARTLVLEDGQEIFGAIAVLHTGGGEDHGEQQSHWVHEEVPRAAFDQFVGIKAADAPCSVVLTD